MGRRWGVAAALVAVAVLAGGAAQQVLQLDRAPQSAAPARVPADAQAPEATQVAQAAPAPVAPPRPTASSTAAGSSADALVDGDPATGQLGAEWAADPADDAPWVQLDLPGAQRIASVQVFGPTAPARDPDQPAATALHGTLRFSDGTALALSGITAAAGRPTTIAFPATTTTSVRLELARGIPGAPVALREITAYAEGTTPPRWAPAAGSPAYSAVPEPASCADPGAADPVAPALPGRLSLSCPAVGSAVTDTAEVLLSAPAGSRLSATADGAPAAAAASATAAAATADGDGRAALSVDVSDLPQGPFAVVVSGTGPDGAPLAPLHVQLFRAAGTPEPAGTGAGPHRGMTLQYADDFDGPLSASTTGWETEYATLKPEPHGGSQFGDAVFADPSWGAGTLATLPGGYLRIRAQDVGAYRAHRTWGQSHVSGLLSSQGLGGAGFSAQQGYFEARVLGAPGPGAWPAFWMLNSESGTPRADGTTGEVDAVELYGHDVHAACHVTHTFTTTAADSGQATCLQQAEDWAAQWHTYGVQVMPGKAEFFVDGRSVAVLGGLGKTEQAYFFMLNLAAGGGWPVDLSATGGTTDMYVDWVRVWT